MGLEITNILCGNYSGKPRILKNGGFRSVESLTEYKTGTGAITDGVDGMSATLSTGASGGRAYLTWSQDLTAGKHYVVLARITNYTGAAPTNLMMWGNYTKSAGVTYRSPTGNGLWAMQFTPDVAQTGKLIRIGFGPTADEPANQSCVISDVCVYELDAYPTTILPPVTLLKPDITEPQNAAYGGGAFVTEFANTYAASGLVTEIAQTTQIAGATEKYRVGCYVSDSFGNNYGDWPDKLASTYGYALFGGSWSGQNMAYFNVRAADVFARTGLGYIGDALPDFAICQSSLNSANAGHTSATMLADMTGLITKALAAGLKPFVLNMTPFGLGGMSAGEKTELLAYNAALPALCVQYNAHHIDVYTAVSDPANRDNLLAAYTSDNVHLNAAGVAVYAAAIDDVISHKRAQAMAPGSAPTTLEVIDSYLSLDSTQYAQAPIGATRIATKGNGSNLYGAIPTWSATNWEIEFDFVNPASWVAFKKFIDADVSTSSLRPWISSSGTGKAQFNTACITSAYLDSAAITHDITALPTDSGVHHIKLEGAAGVNVGTILAKYTRTEDCVSFPVFNLRLTDLDNSANSRFYPMDETIATSTFVDTSANAAHGTWVNRTSTDVVTVYPGAIKPGQEFWIACKFRINSTSISKFLGSIGTFLTGASSIVFRTDASGYFMVSRYNGTTAISHTISTVLPEIGTEYIFVCKKNADNSISLYVDSLASVVTVASGTGLSYALDWLCLNGAKTTIGASSLRTYVDVYYAYLYNSLSTDGINALLAGENPMYVGDVLQGYNLSGDGDEVNGGTSLTLYNSPTFYVPPSSSNNRPLIGSLLGSLISNLIS